MNLTGALIWLRHIRRRPDEPFRLSHALSEQGQYATDYGNWEPLTLEGDPAVWERLKEGPSKRRFEAFLPLIPERAEKARDVLEHWGVLKPGAALSEPEDWELIEYGLARHGEYANGGDIRRAGEAPRLRPRFEAFLLDLCCLAFQTAQALKPDARVIFQNDLPREASPWPLAFPMLAVDGQIVLDPFRRDWIDTVVPEETEAGERTNAFSRRFALLLGKVPGMTPEEIEARMHELLDAHERDQGDPLEEVLAVHFFETHGLAGVEIPDAIWERLTGASKDASG